MYLFDSLAVSYIKVIESLKILRRKYFFYKFFIYKKSEDNILFSKRFSKKVE